MKPLLLLLICLIIITPVIGDKNKGLFSGEILEAELDLFTSNISDTPGHLTEKPSPVQSNLQDIADWMNVGKTQLRSGNWKPAEETFSRIIDRDSKNTDGWEGYLLAIRGEGDYNKLLDVSERASKANPDFASAWKYNGIALSCLDRSEEALMAFDTALRVDPSYYDAWYYKGIALDSLKRYRESVEAYANVVALNANVTKAWNNEGVAWLYIGDYDKAIQAFDRALSIDPGFKKASENKGLAVKEKSKNSLVSVVSIDDAAIFIPSLGSPSGGVSVVITVSPTQSPIPNADPTPQVISVSLKPQTLTTEEKPAPETSSTGTKSGVNMFRGDATHTGEYPGPAATKGVLKWKFKSTKVGTYLDWVRSSPAIANDIVYIGDLTHFLYAIDTTTGSLKWKSEIGGSGSSPAVADDKVYIGSTDSHFYALDARTGALIWKFNAGNCGESSPAVFDGIVYVESKDGNLYALNTENGDLMWKFKISEKTSSNGDAESSPAVVDGIVYIGSRDQSLYALDAETGSLIWRISTNDAIFSSPAVSDGTVYVGSDDRHLYALDAKTGVLKWKFAASSFIRASPGVINGIIFVNDGATLYALDATRNGSLIWHHTITDKYNTDSSPAIAGGIVYVGSGDSNIYALDAGTGTLRWKYTLGSEIYSSPAVVEGVLYIGSDDGYVYAIE